MKVTMQDGESLTVEFNLGYATISLFQGHPRVTLTNYESKKKKLVYTHDADFEDGINAAVYITNREKEDEDAS
jgi:hypothetical protein